MKKFNLLIVFFLMVAIINSGCSKQQSNNNADTQSFIGSFTSDWMDVQKSTPLTFILSLNADKTVELERKTGEVSDWIKTGTWAGNTSKDNFGILCMLDNPNSIIDSYFTFMKLDDGRFSATPSVTTNGSYGTISSFDRGTNDYFVTLIIFKKI